MEREILITGIGGQGVQLASQVLARAATIEGRYVSSLGLYGGMMRGGNTDSTLIVADAPITAPPIVPHAWAAIAMHDEFFAPLAPKLRDGAAVFFNVSTFDEAAFAACPAATPVPVAASERAAELGNPIGAAMVMVGAFVNATALVSIDAAVEAMRQSVPSYRTQHIAANEAALRAGTELVAAGRTPAWVDSVPARAGAPE